MFTAVFACEVLIAIIALGFIKGPKSYLQISGMHRLEMVILMITIVERITVVLKVDFFQVQALRILRTLPILSRFRAFSGIRTIISTLVENFVQLSTVLLLIILFLLACSSLLLIFLSNSFSRRCVVVEEKFGACAADFSTGWVPSPECDFTRWEQTLPAKPLHEERDQDFSILVDDYYPFERWCQIARNTTVGQYDHDPNWDLDFRGRYHSCGRDRPHYKNGSEMCVKLGNPASENGYAHFDNTGGSLLALLQSLTQDGYSDVIWKSIQSESDHIAALICLWLSFGLIATWLLLGIFIAVVTGNFRIARQHQLLEEQMLEDKSKYEANRAKQKLNIADEPEVLTAKQHGEVSWIRHFDEDIEADDGIEAIHAGRRQEMWNIIDDWNDIENVLAQKMRALLTNRIYMHFRSFLICGLVFALACEQQDAGPVWHMFAKVCHIVFNSIFSIELVLRCCAVEGRGQSAKITSFFSNGENIFELAMVSVGIFGVIANIKVFMLIPVFRVYFLMRYLPTLQNLLEMAIGSAKLLSNVFLFICVVALAFSVICREIFGDRMDFARWNFTSFPEALITSFQVFTGDGWSYVLFDAMKAQSDANKSQALPAFLIVSWFVFSGVIINNLLVAAIIEDFEVSTTIANVKKPGYVAALRKKMRGAWKVFVQATHISPFQTRFEFDRAELRRSMAFDATVDAPAEKNKVRSSHINKLVAWAAPVAAQNTEVQESELEVSDRRVLFCISSKNWIRKFAVKLGHSAVFEAIVLAAIFASCFFLLILPPGGLPYKQIKRIDPTFNTLINDEKMKLVDYIFTILFTTECAVRILDRGLYFTKRAYLKDAWNLMDFVLVIMSWIDIMNDLLSFGDVEGSGGKIGKVLRLGRTLRPLRVMKRNPSMRALIGALFGTMHPVAYIILFQMVTLFNFALIGMGMFGGKYQHCRTAEFEDLEVAYPGGKRECMGFFVRPDGVIVQRSWDNPNFHFDSLAQSVKTLFVVQNLPFVDTMHMAMDLTDYDLMHSRNHSMPNAFFFIIYVFVGGTLCINLFVAFIVDGFNISKGTTDQDAFYFRFLRLVSLRKPPQKNVLLPTNFISCFCRSVVEHPIWHKLSIACIVISVGFNLTQNVDNPPEKVVMIKLQNLVFGCVLIFEVFVNFMAYGPRGYARDNFRNFDFVVAAITFGGIMAQFNNEGNKDESFSKFARALRLAGILHLMAKIKSVQTIVETAIHCLPELANIMLLLVLIYSIFAVLFTQFFGLVRYGERLGDTANFYSFGRSLFTIYQIVTGDAWELLLSDSSVEWPRCTKSFDEKNVPGWTAWKGEPLYMTDCGGQFQAFLSYVVLKIVCQQIMLNLFVGMILENFSFMADESSTHQTTDESWSKGPSDDQIEMTAKIFFLFCKRRHKISLRLSDLRAFLCEFPLPIGFRRADGTLMYGKWERAATKIIRAELNVILRDTYIEREMRELSRWDCFRRYISFTEMDRQTEDARLVHEVGYETLMKTCLFWRKPDMVPPAIKEQRRKRVDDVVCMAYALMIKDALCGRVARTIAKKMKKKLEAATRFLKWETADPARCRQREQWAEEFASEKELAFSIKKQPAKLYWPPTETIHSIFDFIQDVPEDMVSHHDAFLTSPEIANADVFHSESSSEFTSSDDQPVVDNPMQEKFQVKNDKHVGSFRIIPKASELQLAPHSKSMADFRSLKSWSAGALPTQAAAQSKQWAHSRSFHGRATVDRGPVDRGPAMNGNSRSVNGKQWAQSLSFDRTTVDPDSSVSSTVGSAVQSTVRKGGKRVNVQAVKGLKTFLEYSKTHLVVLKDLGTDTQNNYFIGDLTELNFSGWIQKNTPQDTFFSPLMRHTSAESVAAKISNPWTAIDSSLIRYKQEMMFVRVCQIRKFAHIQQTVGFKDKTDPYVKITYGDTVLRTTTATDEGGAVAFEEIFEFPKSLLNNILFVQVYDEDALCDQCMGEVDIDLTQQIFADGSHPDDEIWFDCFKHGMIKGTIQLAFSKQRCELPAGSLVDIQSYIHDEKKMGEEILQFSNSRVRLNIGILRIHSLQERLNSLHNSSQKESSSDPRVLEVVGYVKRFTKKIINQNKEAHESNAISKMSKVFSAVRKLPGALNLHGFRKTEASSPQKGSTRSPSWLG